MSAAFAQDQVAVQSLDGHVECRLFFAQPEPGALFRLAYQVSYRGKLVIDTSFVGLEIETQPVLGENAGLIASRRDSTAAYKSLTAEYMQNGSLGRRLNVEVRAFDDGVAFRYLVPTSTPLEEILIENESTEFRFAGDPPPRLPESSVPLPFTVEEPGAAWIEITEVRGGNFPSMHLLPSDDRTLISRLPQHGDTPKLAVEAKTPLVGPWRVLVIAPTRERLNDAKILSSLR